MAKIKSKNTAQISPIPRYLEVAETLQDEIQAGVYAVGELIPTEQELCQRFSASRFTVREALKRLITNGLVSRKQGSGTRVISTTPNENFIQELASIDELLQYSKETRLSVSHTEFVTTDIALASLLQSTPGEGWQKIESIRLLNERQSICWTDIYVRPEFKTLVNHIGKDPTPAFQLIEKEFGVSPVKVNVQIQAGSLSKQHAEALGVEEGSPMLVVIRRYHDQNGRIYEVSVSEHPAERFSYSIDLTKR